MQEADSSSEWITFIKLTVLSEVPHQGSILGPLLFLIYIDDVTNLPIHMAVLYADDLLLLHAIKSQDDFHLLQKDVIGCNRTI